MRRGFPRSTAVSRVTGNYRGKRILNRALDFGERNLHRIVARNHHVADGHGDRPVRLRTRTERRIDVHAVRPVLLFHERDHAPEQLLAGAVALLRADRHADRERILFLAPQNRALRVEKLAAVLIMRMQPGVRLMRTGTAAEAFSIALVHPVVVLRLLKPDGPCRCRTVRQHASDGNPCRAKSAGHRPPRSRPDRP